MKTRRRPDPNRGVVLLFTTALIVTAAGCNPAVYKRPAADFQSASAALRDTYFLEWELSNRARIERGDLDDQIAIWSAPSAVQPQLLDEVSDKMAERRQKDIHAQLRPLREKAFAALDGYASTLVGLSSDESTEAIISELNGLAQDITGTLETVKKIKPVAGAVGKVQRFAGPLQQYVDVLNNIVEIVSAIARERAIVKTIGKSNDSILELLGVLKEEATAIQANATDQTSRALASIEAFLASPKGVRADNDLRAALAKRRAELRVIQGQIAQQDIGGAFDAAVKAQGSLVQKAMLDDPGNWTLRIREFKQHVAETKEALEKIHSDM